MKRHLFFSLCLLALSLFIASCGAKVDIKPVCGTIEEPLANDSVSNDSTQKTGIPPTLDPYAFQQALLPHLGYSINGEDISLYIDGKCVSTMTSTISDMGGFDDDAIWIGEMISFDNTESGLLAHVVPGVKYVVGLVLHYEDMPTISAAVTMHDDGKIDLSDIKIEK